MSSIYQFLIVLLSAIVLQNAVITRGFGSTKETIMMASPKKTLLFGCTLTVIATIAALLGWPANYLLRKFQVASLFGIRYLSSFILLAIICLVYAAIYLLTRAYLPKLHYYLRDVISLATFNCALLGSILIAFSGSYDLLKTVGFAIGSGIGYTLALLLIYEGRRRIVLSDVPRSFRGLPVTLLYVGILSLAIYGLIGHQLPT